MICPVKPIKTRTTKISSIDKAFALPDRSAQPDPIVWGLYTTGPFIVPVTRWIE